MNLRLFAILLLLLPALRGLDIAFDQSGSCDTPVCCEIVKFTSCCGEVSYEEICSKSGGECQCTLSPSDLPPTSPPPLLPISLGELILELPEPTELISFTVADDQSCSISIQTERVFGVPTHNQAQAILGIWRL